MSGVAERTPVARNTTSRSTGSLIFGRKRHVMRLFGIDHCGRFRLAAGHLRYVASLLAGTLNFASIDEAPVLRLMLFETGAGAT